jgi:hypothetical protein
MASISLTRQQTTNTHALSHCCTQWHQPWCCLLCHSWACLACITNNTQASAFVELRALFTTWCTICKQGRPRAQWGHTLEANPLISTSIEQLLTSKQQSMRARRCLCTFCKLLLITSSGCWQPSRCTSIPHICSPIANALCTCFCGWGHPDRGCHGGND